MFTKEQIGKFIEQGWLGKKYFEKDYIDKFCFGKLKPRLAKLAEPERRDIWVEAVGQTVKEFLDVFGYRRFVQ